MLFDAWPASGRKCIASCVACNIRKTLPLEDGNGFFLTCKYHTVESGFCVSYLKGRMGWGCGHQVTVLPRFPGRRAIATVSSRDLASDSQILNHGHQRYSMMIGARRIEADIEILVDQSRSSMRQKRKSKQQTLDTNQTQKTRSPAGK